MKNNPFVVRQTPNSWIVSISLVLMVLGFMVSLVWANNPSGELSRLTSGLTSPDGPDTSDNKFVNLRDEVAQLREEKARLESVLAEGKNSDKEIHESLEQARMLAALTDIEGPGVTITLSDSKKSPEELLSLEAGIIHDIDVLKVVNELRNAGAEAIAVNGERVGPNTDFRCVGSTILVDDVRIASPVEIKAIGDPKTLNGALNLPNGILDEIRDTDESMVKMEMVEMHYLKAYAGSTKFRTAKVPEKKE